MAEVDDAMQARPASEAEIERVAIALYLVGGGLSLNWHRVWEPARVRWRRHAKAAIDALRAPPDGSEPSPPPAKP